MLHLNDESGCERRKKRRMQSEKKSESEQGGGASVVVVVVDQVMAMKKAKATTVRGGRLNHQSALMTMTTVGEVVEVEVEVAVARNEVEGMTGMTATIEDQKCINCSLLLLLAAALY